MFILHVGGAEAGDRAIVVVGRRADKLARIGVFLAHTSPLVLDSCLSPIFLEIVELILSLPVLFDVVQPVVSVVVVVLSAVVARVGELGRVLRFFHLAVKALLLVQQLFESIFHAHLLY